MAQNPEAGKGAAAPIVIDLGRHRRKQVKRLRRGTGKLMDEVFHSLQELKTAGKVSDNAQPVVVVVRERRRSRAMMWPKL
jgi:hypothetical protein